MALYGEGTLTSPFTLDDSEDEVCFELYKGSNHSSSSSLSANLEQPPLSQPWGWSTESQPPHWERKRKRTPSFNSHVVPVAAVPQRGHTTLENRLSQPESKKARKRRRKAQRQALEDVRIQHLNWLNAPSPFASGVPILPLRSWSSDVQMYGGYPPPHSVDRASLSGLTGSEPDDLTLYDNCEPHSVSPPPPPSRWVSSMAMAANDPIVLTEEHDELLQWSSLSTQMPLPPHLASTLPPPPHATNTPNNLTRFNLSSFPKPVEHHALPPKPPPSQPIQTTIGMQPDQDPNSKHGIFQLSSATKEAGTDIKKKGPLYMPNPARTLVMEQLPKSHRHPDFINKWSKSACGAHPVHIFIDGPCGKALVEFATAELARKAWASPKLGPAHAHQVKGKPREDLIKVWWYRVNGVGAGSGVGEIEEGEIEGDVIEKEPDQSFSKETKKEKKARLAKEREEKRVKRELELKLIKERYASLQQLQVEPPSSSTSSFAVPDALMPVLWPSTPISGSPPWSPAQAPAQHLPITSDANSRVEWGRPSPNWGPSTWTIGGQADDLDDYESNMEIDEPQLPPLAVRHVQNAPPLHSSLPPRPTSSISAPLPRVGAQKPPSPPPPSPPAPSPPINLAISSPRPVYKTSPQASPSLPPPSQITLPSGSSSSSTTPPPTSLPSEPRAMKNAPTEPSFTKRALMARQKELKERIAKSKLELGFTSKHETPVSSVHLAGTPIPFKPSTELGEKQAMEDKLRKLVLQSQKARGKAGPAASSGDNSNGASNVSATTPSDIPSISQSISMSSSSSSSSSSSALSSIVSSNQLLPAQLTTVSLSSHDFSLEDLAVSFITQTIETIKSQSTPTPTQTPTTYPSNKLVSTTTTQSNNNNMKLELAAKQRRLEQHIMESKNLMTKLAQARSKEEKDTILKAMREMTRSFEEGSQPKATPTTTTKSPVISGKNPSQGPLVRIWPGSHEDAGVLILSDSDCDDDYESDGD